MPSVEGRGVEVDGAARREENKYVYLEGLLVALINSTEIYYYHTDHLGTPQFLTDQNQAIIWQAHHDPFGRAMVVTQGVVNNPRLPGQHFDSETGLHYNYFRDYDPSLDRYIESDPIGLAEGINTYAYVGGNPLTRIDPTGQFFFLLAPAVPPALAALGDAALIAGGVLAVGALAENIMESRSRGKSDPVSGLQPVKVGRDCSGNCNPCPDPEVWEAEGNTHGSTSGTHWHWIEWNQDKSDPDCTCYPKRGSGPTRPAF